MPGTVEQREQAKAEIRARNQKDIFALPEELKVAGKPVRIYNVGPWRHQRSMGSYGQFTIHPCEEGQEYSIPTEVPYITNDPVHIDMFQMAHRHDSGRKLAADILGVGQFHTPGEDLRPWGVFVSDDDVPTPKELKTAHNFFNKKLDDLIREADGFWNQGPTEYKNITDLHRMAAKSRGQMDKPWARDIQLMIDCPGCGNKINPAAAICGTCKTVINEEKVIALKIPGYKYLWAPKKETKENDEV